MKYSEDDLPDLLEAARKAQRDAETEKVDVDSMYLLYTMSTRTSIIINPLQYERQVRGLREKIVHARKQLEQNSRKKQTFQAKSVLQNTSNEKAEQDLADCM